MSAIERFHCSTIAFTFKVIEALKTYFSINSALFCFSFAMDPSVWKPIKIIIIVSGMIILFMFVMLLALLAGGDDTNYNSNEDTIIDTDCGKVQGKIFLVNTGGKNISVYKFRNIPYAVPPIKEMRWRAPVLLSKDESKCWNGTLAYSESRIACYQRKSHTVYNMSEDCLHLVVTTPSLDSNSNLPVFVWLHGGGMISGSNSDTGYHPYPEFSANLNVVTVSVNYRLGIFGFLSLRELWVTSGRMKSYGNYGIMDQIAALTWIKNNARNFGGDPTHVIIHGQSGGGSAVYNLIASPLARHLFHKAIPASGAPNIQTNHTLANERNRFVLNRTGCNKTSPSDIKYCLQNLDVDILVKASYEPSCISQYTIEFPINKPRPPGNICPIQIIDPVVIPTDPAKIPSTITSNIKILATTNSEEGGPMVISPGWPGNLFQFSDWLSLKANLKPKIDTFKSGLYSTLETMYRNKARGKVSPKVITPSYVYNVMTTDVILSCSTNDFVKHYSKIQPFSANRMLLSQSPSPSMNMGNNSFHGWDSVLLFSLTQFKGVTKKDLALRERYHAIFREFIHSYDSFKERYGNRAIEFWNSTVVQWEQDYHHRECKVLSDNGFLKFSWGLEGRG